MATLFISDLHIGGEQPLVADHFVAFLKKQAAGAEALYILGDLFEVWLGDDAIQAEHRPVLDALKGLSESGTPIYVMHGNRDFLLGDGFETATGCKLIDDPCVIDLYGQPTLLMHGDILCTDDVEYQQFRNMLHNDEWQQQFLGNSVEHRVEIARQYRSASSARNQQKSMAIMDVNQDAVLKAMQEHGVSRMIHGHTHRPAVHELEIDGQAAQRIVLGDWFEQSSQLICAADGCKLINQVRS